MSGHDCDDHRDGYWGAAEDHAELGFRDVIYAVGHLVAGVFNLLLGALIFAGAVVLIAGVWVAKVAETVLETAGNALQAVGRTGLALLTAVKSVGMAVYRFGVETVEAVGDAIGQTVDDAVDNVKAAAERSHEIAERTEGILFGDNDCDHHERNIIQTERQASSRQGVRKLLVSGVVKHRVAPQKARVIGVPKTKARVIGVPTRTRQASGQGLGGLQ